MSERLRYVELPTKRMLNRLEALSYCGLPLADRPPVQPKRVRPGKQGLRYDRLDLDRWLDMLDSTGGAEPSDDELLRGLDGDAGAGQGR
jgi:hypothetical protein